MDFCAVTKVKLARDPRTNGFIEKYGEVYAVELDALPATVPDKFKKLVISSVDKYFDKKIYQENLDEYHITYPEDKVKKLIKQRLKEFLEEF